jgi:hypothetical protein
MSGKFRLQGVLTVEYHRAEVTCTGFRQPVDFLYEVIHQDAIGHDGFTVIGMVVSPFVRFLLAIVRAFFTTYLGKLAKYRREKKSLFVNFKEEYDGKD